LWPGRPASWEHWSIPTGCWPSEAFYIARHFLEFIEEQAIQRSFSDNRTLPLAITENRT
jgi:hypothetical protein